MRFLPRLLLLLAPLGLYAHPEVEAALARLNPLIAARPLDATLYLERGQLYLRHEAWLEAEANFLRAAELQPGLTGLERARGELAFARRESAAARQHFQRELAANPADAETRILHARVLVALGNPTAAIADYDKALATLPHPTPELVLERASLGPTPADALAVLDRFLAQLGPAMALELRALGLEETLGLHAAALRRVDRIAASAERREGWLKRRGDILRRAQRSVEARAAYAEAMEELNRLPLWLRQSPDAIRLAAQLQELLNPPPPTKP